MKGHRHDLKLRVTAPRTGGIRKLLSTGTKDVNGKIIYEGDTVAYRGKSFTIRWCSEGLRFMISGYGCDPTGFTATQAREFEIKKSL